MSHTRGRSIPFHSPTLYRNAPGPVPPLEAEAGADSRAFTLPNGCIPGGLLLVLSTHHASLGNSRESAKERGRKVSLLWVCASRVGGCCLLGHPFWFGWVFGRRRVPLECGRCVLARLGLSAWYDILRGRVFGPRPDD
jgi:hypothetical protein